MSCLNIDVEKKSLFLNVEDFENKKKEKEKIENDLGYINLKDIESKYCIDKKFIKRHSVKYFKNTKKILGDWFISIVDIQEYFEHSSIEGFISMAKVSNEYKIKRERIHQIVKEFNIPMKKGHRGKIYLDENSIRSKLGEEVIKNLNLKKEKEKEKAKIQKEREERIKLKKEKEEQAKVKKQLPSGYVRMGDLSSLLEISNYAIKALVRKGIIHETKIRGMNCYNIGELKNYYEYIEEQKRQKEERESREKVNLIIPKNFITKQELKKIIGKSNSTISRLVKKGVLRREKIGKHNYYDKNFLSDYYDYKISIEKKANIKKVSIQKSNPLGGILTNEIAKTLSRRIKETIFIDEIKRLVTIGFYHIDEIVEKLMVDKKEVVRACKQGIIDCNYIKKEIFLHNSQIKLLQNHFDLLKEIEENRYISLGLAAQMLKKQNKTISKMCSEGILSYAEVYGKLYLKKDTILNYLQEKEDEKLQKQQAQKQRYEEKRKKIEVQKQKDEEKRKKIEGFIKISEAAKILDVCIETVSKYIKKGIVEKSNKVGRNIYICMEEINTLKKERELNRVKSRTKEELIAEYASFINGVSVRTVHKKTFDLYKKFGLAKLNATEGRISNIRRTLSYVIRLYEDILTKLKGEIFSVSEESIELVLKNQKYSNPLRELFLKFIKYAFSNSNMELPREYMLSRKVKLTNKDINDERYSPETYQVYYLHTKNTQHISAAITSREYSNMWVFVTMLLTNAWRPSDIIYEMPRIDLEVVGIADFVWFQSNVLTLENCNLIIQQLYLKLNNAEASKTSTVLNFLVVPTMIEALANACVISELHARKAENSGKYEEKLLGSFINQNTLETNTSGNRKHKKFFGKNIQLKDFKSRKLQNSTITYLFLGISENQESAELSLEMPAWMRSHKSIETTATYIKLTNKDGTLDRVAINLYDRGHFGWLYNYMVQFAYKNLNYTQTIEQRTDTIIDLKKEFMPLELEDWSKELLNQTEKQRNVIYKLNQLDEDYLKQLILKVFKGEMPARDTTGQCLNFPSCEYPNRKLCVGCEFHIPQLYQFLFEIKIEFFRLIDAIEKNTSSLLIKRDTKLLMNLLVVLNEAVNTFGIEIINSFISIEERKENLHKIIGKLIY
ncbi:MULTISPECIES: hypothetical protein [unclassified Lysinibacillus]|uniref:hypothetical protein n=1 Tax=unclassified Lysinibacillus TaxID=2636778 RepID=UPI0031F46820